MTIFRWHGFLTRELSRHGLKTRAKEQLSLLGSFAGHHFFGGHLHRFFRRLLDNSNQPVMLGLGERPALRQLHPVSFARLVLLIMRVQNRAALQVLAVLLVPGLVGDDDLDRLVALVGRHHTFDRAERGTFFGFSFRCCHGGLYFFCASVSRCLSTVIIRAMSLRVFLSWLGSSSFSVTAWARRSNRCLRASSSSCLRCWVSFSRISL